MKLKMFLLPALMLGMSGNILAQEVKAGKAFTFGSQNYAGILEGEIGTSFQAHTINGLKYKSWFGGIGVGLDYYYDRSIPVFISVSKFLPYKKVPFYFNGDIGIHIPWVPDTYDFWASPSSYTPGLYWSSGLGYKFGLKQGNGLLLNLGYTYKHFIQEINYSHPCLVAPCPTQTERYDAHLRRLSVKLGYMF